MKRRNVDVSKTRRPTKKLPKLYDGVYSSVVVYVKLLLLWICVMGGNYILDFRLEYIYPIYLLLHNSYEAYKFQGLAFALLLVCIVVSVDVICIGVIPAPWLYLIGSIFVWGQIGYSLTPLGPLLLLPTLLYIDGKTINARTFPISPYSPLAAHCVGFPLVSLGFGLKSFIGGRLKQRNRNEVARQNEFLYSLLWEALPFTNTPPPVTVNNNEMVIQNGSAVLLKKQQHQQQSSLANGVSSPPGSSHLRRKSIEAGVANGEISKENLISKEGEGGKSSSSHHHHSNHSSPPAAAAALNSNSSSFSTSVNGGSSPTSTTNNNPSISVASPAVATSPCSCMLLPPKKKKDDCCYRLESEARKLRSDLHSVRTIESELRGQICSLLASERNLRGELASLQGEHEALQLKYSALSARGQEERQVYEKRLLEERRLKESAINKQKKASQDCSGDCKKKLREADRERDAFRREIKSMEDKNVRIERELQNVKSTLMHEQKNKENLAENSRLQAHMQTIQEQNALLESNLNAETRLKLDLFSALGEARRQLSIRDSMIKSKDDELEEARSQLVELLAVSDFSGSRVQSNQMLGHHMQVPYNHLNHHSLLRGQKNLSMSLGSVGEIPTSSPQQGNENLTFSPLIES